MLADRLFPYQRQGAEFLASRATAYLADDMGLGKTAQAIAAADRVDARNILVICPASIRTQWVREWRSFQKKPRTAAAVYDANSGIPTDDVIVVSFDLACKPEILQRLCNSWDVVILDEAHYLKSPEASRSIRIIGKEGIVHQATRIWLLSGTPTPNNAGELWTALRVFYPAALRNGKDLLSYDAFLRTYCRVKDSAYGLKVLGNTGRIGELRERIQPFLLRRTKADVALQLPTCRVDEIVLDAAPRALTAVRAAEMGEGGRQMKAWLHGSDDLLVETPPLATLSRETGLAKVAPILDLIHTDLQSGVKKLVVFAWHREVIGLIAAGLAYRWVMLTGDTLPDRRQHVVDTFQNDPDVRVFIGQIKAAGTGLNLTAAHNVLFAEMSWVPADNAQAAMRVHRIGQTQPVLIRFAKLAGSLDEAVVTTLRRKTAMIEELFKR